MIPAVIKIGVVVMMKSLLHFFGRLIMSLHLSAYNLGFIVQNVHVGVEWFAEEYLQRCKMNKWKKADDEMTMH